MAKDRPLKRKKIQNLASDILSLARELTRVKKQAEALGWFNHDSELPECSGCDLAEDVTFNGCLTMYYRKSSDYSDTGLRFERLNDTTFRCPICMTTQKATMP